MPTQTPSLCPMSTFGTVLAPRDHVISDYSALRVQQFKQSTCKGCDSNHAVTAAANVVLLRKTGRPRLGLLTAHIMAATVTARWRCSFLLIKCFFLPIKCIPHINEYFSHCLDHGHVNHNNFSYGVFRVDQKSYSRATGTALS